jgi:hypothetical protein
MSEPREIRALCPNVERDEAARGLRPGWFGSVLRGPLRRLADVYLPYQLCRVSIANGGSAQEQWIAVDLLRATFDLYAFPVPPECITVTTRNYPQLGLSPANAAEALVRRVERMVFRQGFFRIRGLRIVAEPHGEPFYVPYWVGFAGTENRLQLRVMDAVRRRIEGPKLRAAVVEWLQA